ncbi:5206_t:CDS:2, partial [Scutellospora calospora]
PKKALQMSKLRADIIYSHRIQPDLAIHTYDDIFAQQSEIDPVEQNNIEMSNLDSENNQSFFEDTEEFPENIEIEEFLDEELDNKLTVDILDEERWQFNDKDIEAEYVDKDEFSINNIVHLATNTTAKCELATLFRELEL